MTTTEAAVACGQRVRETYSGAEYVIDAYHDGEYRLEGNRSIRVTEAELVREFVRVVPEDEARATCLRLLSECKSDTDREAAHGDADDALCMYLRAIGRADIADAFGLVEKWYA